MFVSVEDAVRFALRARKAPVQSLVQRSTYTTMGNWERKKKTSNDAPVAHSPAQKTIQKRRLGVEKTQSMADVNQSATAMASMDVWAEKPPAPLFEQKSQDSMDKTQ